MEWHLEDLNTAGAVHFLLNRRAKLTFIGAPGTSTLVPKDGGLKFAFSRRVILTARV